MKKLLVAFALSSSVSFSNAQEILEADIPHCRVEFSVSFLQFAKQTGVLPDLNISLIKRNSDFSDSKVSFTGNVKSLNTNHPIRNNHLQEEGFFHSEQYPTLSFESRSFEKIEDDVFKMTGDLTIKGITKISEFYVVLSGENQDPITNDHLYIFNITGTFNRLDFGIGEEYPDAAIGTEISLDSSIILKKAE